MPEQNDLRKRLDEGPAEEGSKTVADLLIEAKQLQPIYAADSPDTSVTVVALDDIGVLDASLGSSDGKDGLALLLGDADEAVAISGAAHGGERTP